MSCAWWYKQRAMPCVSTPRMSAEWQWFSTEGLVSHRAQSRLAMARHITYLQYVCMYERAKWRS